MENGNEPAFASMNEQEVFFGLTKREYFAAMAMQGLLVNYANNEQYGNYPMVSEIAVQQADALIEALNV